MWEVIGFLVKIPYLVFAACVVVYICLIPKAIKDWRNDRKRLRDTENWCREFWRHETPDMKARWEEINKKGVI